MIILSWEVGTWIMELSKGTCEEPWVRKLAHLQQRQIYIDKRYNKLVYGSTDDDAYVIKIVKMQCVHPNSETTQMNKSVRVPASNKYLLQNMHFYEEYSKFMTAVKSRKICSWLKTPTEKWQLIYNSLYSPALGNLCFRLAYRSRSWKSVSGQDQTNLTFYFCFWHK